MTNQTKQADHLDLAPQISFVPGAIKGAAKAVSASSSDLWKVHPSKLRVYQGFNARLRDDAYEQRVRWIADSIKEHGYWPQEPVHCFAVREGGEDVMYVWDGHRRVEGALLAIQEGAELAHIPVLLVGKEVGVEELTAGLVTSNDSDPLRPYEVAMVVKRLTNFQWDLSRIAQRLKLTETWCDGLLLLANGPVEIRAFVAEGKIAAHEAIKLMRQHGSAAIGLITEAVRRAQEAGKSKATARFVPGGMVSKVIRKRAPAMFDVIERLRGDAVYHKMSPELREQLEALYSEISGVKQTDAAQSAQQTIEA